jgi:hypothetical protein
VRVSSPLGTINVLKGQLGLGKAARMKTGSNEASGVVWVLGDFIFIFYFYI